MAHPQAYAANKGTLAPGQTISVNKYTVQVDRYLSQGGFAHVYLVRTPTPVYNTTHHVLKRIAVPNEGMLSEVKKEVDIMRILKGHPNIVHLIDAAWHRMSNGMYEVFILMEFCPGGGIIDMMNRRLRERLTEAEIMQIFVDVCEGVAAMHNLRPALLHRDLKVENILQSSATSYKLCDFGSATPVAPRPPSNTQEIRALEADLNRHTTLQYRAPEMVDPYLRRPVDEKSDVWALGVLLYKLCYYTTPFEEHGPLAILNVQYKIPPYPVYSAQMNALIGSMLREHGAQRPTVFEVLNNVHRLRGTKSRFVYAIPSREPFAQRHAELPPPNPLDDLVSYRSSSSTSIPHTQASTSPAKNAGVQAREKVLEAIAPMRRGRPAPLQTTQRPTSPYKAQEKENNKQSNAELDMDFAVEEEASWKAVKHGRGAVRGHRSGLTSPEAWKVRNPPLDDAWDLGRDRDKEKDRNRRKTYQGELAGFGDSFDGMLGSSSSAAAASALLMPDRSGSKAVSIPSQQSSNTAGRYGPPKAKDAFDGLGFSPSDKAPPPTLAEAWKAKSDYSSNLSVPAPASRPPSALAPRPSPSPHPPSHVPSPIPSPNLAAEDRFPSLEDLDRALLSSGSIALPLHSKSQPPLYAMPIHKPPPPSSTATAGQTSSLRNNFTGGLKPPGAISNTLSLALGGSKYGYDGVRSEHVTGAAMRESREARKPTLGRESPKPVQATHVRPQVTRKHRSAASVREPSSTAAAAPAPEVPPTAAQILRRTEPQDWLTGSDDEVHQQPPGTPVLRDSPSKRASVIERDPVVQSPQEAVADKYPSPKRQPSPPTTPSPSPLRANTRRMTTSNSRLPQKSKPKPLDGLDVASSTRETLNKGEALTENWSPVAPVRPSMRRDNSSSSGGSEGPEDVNGFVPGDHTKKAFELKEKVGETRRRGKGRQSSVHDLVDLWGGGASVEKAASGLVNELSTGSHQKPQEVKRPTPLPATAALVSHPRSVSPSPLLSPPAEPVTRAYSPGRTSPQHRKQTTTTVEYSSPPTPVSPVPSGRSRHQSLFLSPGAASKAPPQTHVEKVMAPSTLALPPDPRARRNVRRTSISDMVQKYEAMGGKPIVVPSTPTKPSHMKVASHGTASPMPTGNGTTSPSRPRHNFGPGLPQGNPDDGPWESDPPKPRTSPTASRIMPVGLPGMASDRKPPEMPSGRRSPFKPVSTGGQATPTKTPLKTPVRPIPVRTASPAPAANTGEEPPRSASPDKPYQGVGRLIDQWQKKASEPEGDKKAGFAGRRAGVVAGRGR